MRNLSVLVHGTDDDKYNWMFDLYDLNGDGYISREEMEDVVFSVNILITLVTALCKYFSWSHGLDIPTGRPDLAQGGNDVWCNHPSGTNIPGGSQVLPMWKF